MCEQQLHLITPERIQSEVEQAMKRRVAFHASPGSSGDGSLNVLVLADGFGIAIRLTAADRGLPLDEFRRRHVTPLTESWKAYKASNTRE